MKLTKEQILQGVIEKLLDEAKVPMKLHLEVLKKLDESVKNHKKDIEKWNQIIESHKIAKGDPGNEGYTPIKGKDYFDGENFVPTENDLKSIAKYVPKIERIIEKTQVIKEQPIVTEKIVKETVEKETIDEEKLFQLFIDRIKKEQLLDSSNIKGLQGFVKNGVSYKFEELMKGGGSQGTITYSVDLSSQCDGNNKVFTVPTNSGFILLTGTDSPLIYKQTTDYTGTGTTTLTLTSAVNAPSLGATFILTYKA